MKLLIFAVALVFGAVSSAQAQQTVRDLSFMSGCWATPKGAPDDYRECFTAPYAGLIQGSSQMVKDKKTINYEFAVIAETNGVITYAPFHMGKALAVFTLKTVADATATFENLENDFPKRVIYRRNKDGSLTARIEGETADDPQNQEWVMAPQGAP
jgi:hypothetical protein